MIVDLKGPKRERELFYWKVGGIQLNKQSMLYRMEARQNIKLGPRKNMSPDSISISLQKID